MPRVISCNEHKREVTVLQNLANKQVDRVFTFDKVCFYPYYDICCLHGFLEMIRILNIHFLSYFVTYARFLGPKHSKDLFMTKPLPQLLMKFLMDSTVQSLHMDRQGLVKHILWRVG